LGSSCCCYHLVHVGIVDADAVDHVQQVLGVHGEDVGGRQHSLSIFRLDSCVVVLLCELHAVDEVAHVLGQDLVGHLHLAVRVGGEGRDQPVHRSQQLPQFKTNLEKISMFGIKFDFLLTFLTRSRYWFA